MYKNGNLTDANKTDNRLKAFCSANVTIDGVVETKSYKFYIDNTSYSNEASNDFKLDLTNLSVGEHTLAAVATINGKEYRSESINFIITGLPYECGTNDSFAGWTGGSWNATGKGMNTARSANEACYAFGADIRSPKFYAPTNIAVTTEFRVWFYALSRTSNYGYVSSNTGTTSAASINPNNYTTTNYINKDLSLSSGDQYFYMSHQSGYTWGIMYLKVFYK